MRRSALATLAVAAVSAVYFALFVGYGVNVEDEGLLLLQIARTVRGELPYVDFHTGYTPLAFYLNAVLVWVFGESTLPLRWALVFVNAAAVGLLFALARPWAGGAIAAVMALGYAAFLPCVVGEFASFNIPYPSWYSATAFLAALWAMDRHLARGGTRHLLLAGLFCGLAFGFKPNAGVLSTLSCGMTLAMLHAGRGDPDRRGASVLLVLGMLVIATAFAANESSVELVVIGGPALVVVLARLVWARDRDADAPPLWSGIACVAAGVAVLVLPWAVPFLARLGAIGFLRDVLLVGSEADQIYARPFPMPYGFPAAWPLVLAVGLVVAGLIGVAAHREHVHVAPAAGLVAVAGAVAAGLLFSWARMPEGVLRSIYWQAQYVGFFLVPPMIVAAGVAVLLRLRRGTGTFGVRDRRLLNLVVFSMCMYVMLWPRVDTMHLIGAMPAALVLAAACASRFAGAWGSVLRLPPWLARAAVAVPAGALALVAALPNLEGPLSRPQVAVDSPRLPVGIEAARAQDLRAIDAVIAHLRARLQPGEALFAFPALALVPYALGHPTPTPHDYFFPGRPDHRAEAEIVRTLEAAPPRYVLTMNRRLGFFSESPMYYFILREYLRRGWVLEARYGRYDVLVRADQRQGPPMVREFGAPFGREQLLTELSDPDRERRRAAVLALLADVGRDADVGAAVRAVARDDGTLLLLLRDLGEAADARITPFMLEMAASPDGRLRGEANQALAGLALRDIDGAYLVGGSDGAPTARLADHLAGLPVESVRGWLSDHARRRDVGFFAGRALGMVKDRGAIPLLEEVLLEDVGEPLVQVAAGMSLVELGEARRLCDLVALLARQRPEIQDVVPSFLIDSARVHPEETRRCLAEGLGSASRRVRETSAWIAGAAGVDALAPELQGRLDDDDPGVRVAAVWALGALREARSRDRLTELASDPDPQVRAFAREALARIGA